MLHTSGFKRFLSVFLALAFVLTLTAFASEARTNDWQNYSYVAEYAELEEIPEIFALQSRAIEAYSALRRAFVVNYDGSVTYPTDYAGAWIEDFKLHIAVTPGMQQSSSMYAQLLEGFEDVVVFTEANFSLNELNQIRTVVFNVLREEGIPAIGHYVDVKQNRINMSFLEIDENSISSALSNEFAVLGRMVDSDVFDADVFAELFDFSVGEFVDPESVELRGGTN